MTDKKPSLSEFEEAYEYLSLDGFNGSEAAYDALRVIMKHLAHAKEREALVEAVVKAARDMNAAMSEGAWKDEPRMGYDEVQIDKWELAAFKYALAALDRFDAGEEK